jgi:site-specific DNA-methyltransferase (cytosine-N4-specific)
MATKPRKRKKAPQITVQAQAPEKREATRPIYETRLGSMYCGNSLAVLADKSVQKKFGKAQLIFTSPPFPLNAKKSYGNLQGEKYIAWLAKFAPLLTGLLKPRGSIVIEIGNAWEPERPVMSTVVLKALLRFLEAGGLSLCQEFVWYNPARLPSPVQWVNVERSRVKDAFTRIWWMSPSDRPKADNRRVLAEYSPSMKRLIRTQTYNAGTRPSEHNIGKKSFLTDNGGAIPPNVFDGHLAPGWSTLLKGTNTRSADGYLEFCRKHDFKLHPARMPNEIVKFFVKFLTDKGDLVIDPFGGSNTTGAVAEELGRKWVSCEANWSFAATSVSRFKPSAVKRISKGLSRTAKKTKMPDGKSPTGKKKKRSKIGARRSGGVSRRARV